MVTRVDIWRSQHLLNSKQKGFLVHVTEISSLIGKENFFLLYMNSIYFLHLIFFLWYFQNKHSHIRSGIYTNCSRVFLDIFNDLVSEMWVSKLITEDIIFSERIRHFWAFWAVFFYFFSPVPTYSRIANKMRIFQIHSAPVKSVPLYSEVPFFYRFCKWRTLHILQNRLLAQNHIKYANAWKQQQTLGKHFKKLVLKL